MMEVKRVLVTLLDQTITLHVTKMVDNVTASLMWVVSTAIDANQTSLTLRKLVAKVIFCHVLECRYFGIKTQLLADVLNETIVQCHSLAQQSHQHC